VSALMISCRPFLRDILSDSHLGVVCSCCRTKVTGTELEKKIAEACSNKPWGASSTLQSEIAQATYN